MNSTLGLSFLRSSALIPYPNLTNSRRLKIHGLFNRQRKGMKLFAMHRDRDHAHEHDYNGKLVDEDMIVLRLRIHDMKMMEETCESAPSNWMEWEKTYYEDNKYVSDICEGVGLLQTYLMNTRPSLALAMLVLVLLSVPISMGVVMLRVIEIAKEVLI